MQDIFYIDVFTFQLDYFSGGKSQPVFISLSLSSAFVKKTSKDSHYVTTDACYFYTH